MSILNWFLNKNGEAKPATPDSSGFGPVDATVPLVPSDRLRPKHVTSATSHAANRKTERLERRELVYSVVRDSMTRAGVLAASFKFKVLSLDVGGYQYLIMIDLADQSAGDTARLAEIEAVVAQAAKTRHGILVTAVYWRINEHVTAGLSPAQPAVRAERLQATPLEPTKCSPEAATPVPKPELLTLVQPPARFEPLQAEEVAAFKRALASAPTAVPLSAPGQIIKSGPRNPVLQPDFQDTQIVSPDELHSPLSITQYGDLN